MSYVPINGLRMLAVETCILLVAAFLAYLFLRFFPTRMPRPRWLNAILAKNWRGVLLVVVFALVGRALIATLVRNPTAADRR